MRRTATRAVCGSIIWIVFGSAGAQDTSGTGRYGSADLSADFRPDPHTVSVVAGGATDVSELIAGCSGLISESQPDYEVNYSSPGEFSLGFYVTGEADTTLLINDPSGDWYCNDDFDAAGGRNPGVVFDSPSAGVYDIWVGAYDSDDNGTTVELTVSEVGAPWEPLYGTTALSANFTPDPFVADVLAGGRDQADTLVDGCSGYVNAARPDMDLEYSDAGRFRLGIFADSESDTTLVVRDPAGLWHCNDDFSDTSERNPGIEFGDPTPGRYSIWVGTYSENDTGSAAQVLVTESGTPWNGSGSGNTSSAGDGTQLISSGTGFVVSTDNHVLTNHHVIDGCNRVTFQLRGQVAEEAALLAANLATDLALLLSEGTSDSPARFRGGATVRLGEELVVYGFPLLGDLSSQGNLTNGIVSALSGLDDDLSRMQMTAQIQPGNSGGPVMDRHGNIVGVVVETANDEYFREQRGTVTQNVNFAIRDSMARSFLDTNNVDYTVTESTGPEISIADIAEQAQRFTGTVLCYR